MQGNNLTSAKIHTLCIFFWIKEVLLNRKENTEGDDKDQRKRSKEGKTNEVQPASPNEYLKWQHHQKLS